MILMLLAAFGLYGLFRTAAEERAASTRIAIETASLVSTKQIADTTENLARTRTEIADFREAVERFTEDAWARGERNLAKYIELFGENQGLSDIVTRRNRLSANKQAIVSESRDHSIDEEDIRRLFLLYGINI
jgi:hypothetical protein